MALLRIADSFYVGVRDLNAVVSWYIDKLGLRRTVLDLDDDEGEGCVALGFDKKENVAIVIGPVSKQAGRETRMLYSGAIEKAHDWLNSRGVSVGPISTDRQGTRYFSLQDLEGNQIEVSEEP